MLSNFIELVNELQNAVARLEHSFDRLENKIETSFRIFESVAVDTVVESSNNFQAEIIDDSEELLQIEVKKPKVNRKGPSVSKQNQQQAVTIKEKFVQKHSTSNRDDHMARKILSAQITVSFRSTINLTSKVAEKSFVWDSGGRTISTHLQATNQEFMTII